MIWKSPDPSPPPARYPGCSCPGTSANWLPCMPIQLRTVVEEELASRPSLFANDEYPQGVRGRISHDRGQREGEAQVLVDLAVVGVAHGLVLVEILADGRSLFGDDSRREDVIGVELDVSSSEEVVGGDLERTHLILGDGETFGRKRLEAARFLLVPLVVEIEMGLVADDGAADPESGLERLLVRLRLIFGKKRAPGVQRVVAEIAVGPAGELVGPTAGDHVHHRSRRSPELGRVLVREHLILGDDVEHDPHLRARTRPQQVVVVVGAVDHEHVVGGHRSVGIHLAAFEGGVPGLRRHAGNVLREIGELTEVRRNVVDLLSGERPADAAAGELD